jgi:hypothetical protein
MFSVILVESLNLYNGDCHKYKRYKVKNIVKDMQKLSYHACSKTLSGESRFHRDTPLGIISGSFMRESKWVVHWTSETWCECSEIAGSPHASNYEILNKAIKGLAWTSQRGKTEILSSG